MENSKLYITQLTIQDCLGCKEETFTFTQNDRVKLLIYSLANSNSCSSKKLPVTPIGQALQLLCTKEFATINSLSRLPQLTIGKGSVQMTFKVDQIHEYNVYGEEEEEEESDLDDQPSTSQAARLRENQRQIRLRQRREPHTVTTFVKVNRRFDDVRLLDRVMVKVNDDEWKEMAISDFHDVFFVQHQHVPDNVPHLSKGSMTNWRKVICTDFFNNYTCSDDHNPFEKFAKLFYKPEYQPDNLLETLTSDCLQAMELERLSEQRFVIAMFDKIRFVFEYITNKEYTIYFFISQLNRYATLDSINVNDIDLNNVRTSIRLCSDSSSYFNHHTNSSIMELVHVSFQLALALEAKQTVVFLGNMEKLADFITMQYIKASFMNSTTRERLPKFVCSRYLHSIIKLARSLNMMVFIEYPSSLTLLPEPCYVIKCDQRFDGNWIFKLKLIDNNGDESAIVQLKDIIECE